ncbi:putative transmembrane protein [Gregarina niphandrodes]|uniref:Transmembrane protein n=1 Tax=Gregarina niphandrodes TaxID=110365 RepID=A0A023B875_GRENI|nr:putative transmembrane protein [Gregarina niphandrodes]EZG68558.1 putative transmembrane protein [Gregarina niphandrodes]|eukprot:XP_011134565.1 putative transmembrane protein [Gregarina niphandrodes]
MRSAAIKSTLGSGVSPVLLGFIPVGIAHISLYATRGSLSMERQGDAYSNPRPADNASPCEVASAVVKEILSPGPPDKCPPDSVPYGQQYWTQGTSQVQQQQQQSWVQVQPQQSCAQSCAQVQPQQSWPQTQPQLIDPSVLFPRVRELLDPQERVPDTFEEFSTATFRDPFLRRMQSTVLEEYDRLKEQFIQEIAGKVHNHCDMAYYINNTYFYAWLLGRPMTSAEQAKAALIGKQNKVSFLQDFANKTMTNGLADTKHLNDDHLDFDDSDYEIDEDDSYEVLQSF